MRKLITFCPTNQIACETNERTNERKVAYSYFWPDYKFQIQSTRITREAETDHNVAQIFSQ